MSKARFGHAPPAWQLLPSATPLRDLSPGRRDTCDVRREPRDRLIPVPTARIAVEQWDHWVGVLERVELLDRLEYEALVSARDEAENLVEMAGSDRLVELLDEIDARFLAVTTEEIESLFERPGGGWWRRRMPSHPGAVAYFLDL